MFIHDALQKTLQPHVDLFGLLSFPPVFDDLLAVQVKVYGASFTLLHRPGVLPFGLVLVFDFVDADDYVEIVVDLKVIVVLLLNMSPTVFLEDDFFFQVRDFDTLL